jgi:hypothetical protein
MGPCGCSPGKRLGARARPRTRRRIELCDTLSKKVCVIIELAEQASSDFPTVVVGVLRAVDAGVAYPIRSNMCGGCPFRRRCEEK